MKTTANILILMLVLAVPPVVFPHTSTPVYVQINETTQGKFQVDWRVPTVLPYAAIPVPVPPSACKSIASTIPINSQYAYSLRQFWTCDTLAGETLSLQYPAHNPGLSVVFHVSLVSGQSHIKPLGPGINNWTIPRSPSLFTSARNYLVLGVRHIFTGVDHLLFVLLLLLMTVRRRRLVAIITGFTLGHSVTLFFATFDYVPVALPLVEALIALSIILLACEIIRADPRSVILRFPASVSALFGLLHGFGFAGSLRELGLLQEYLLTSFFAFNVGIEIGQILFISAVLLLSVSLRTGLNSLQLRAWLPARTIYRVSAYAAGAMACVWYVERVHLFVPG